MEQNATTCLDKTFRYEIGHWAIFLFSRPKIKNLTQYKGFLKSAQDGPVLEGYKGLDGFCGWGFLEEGLNVRF